MQFLVIARVFEGVSTEQVFPLVKPEVAQAWEYYAADLVRTIHYIADQSGAVLLFEADSLEIVNEAVAQFPIVKAGFLKVEVLPLKPYVGIAELFSAQG